MNCPTSGPGNAWFPPSVFAQALQVCRLKGSSPSNMSFQISPPEVWGPTSTSHKALPSLCHFLYKVRLRGAVDLNMSHLTLGPQQTGQGARPQLWILCTSYSQNIYGTAVGAELGLPGVMPFPSQLPAVFWVYNQGEKYVWVWLLEREAEDRRGDRELGTQTGDKTGELGYVRVTLSAWCDGSCFLSCFSLNLSQGRCHPTCTEYLLCSNNTRWSTHLYVNLKLSSLLMRRLGYWACNEISQLTPEPFISSSIQPTQWLICPFFPPQFVFCGPANE